MEGFWLNATLHHWHVGLELRCLPRHHLLHLYKGWQIKYLKNQIELMKILNTIHIFTSHRLVHNILACTVSITLFLSGLCCASCNMNSQLTNELRKTALENEDTFNSPRRYLQKPVKVSSLNGEFTTVFTSLNHEIPSFRFSMSTYIRIFAQESITSSGEYRNEKIKTHNTYIKKRHWIYCL